MPEAVLRGFRAHGALDECRLGVAQLVELQALVALAARDLLAVHPVGAHVLGEHAEAVVDREVAPPARVVVRVDELPELVGEHGRLVRLMKADGGKLAGLLCLPRTQDVGHAAFDRHPALALLGLGLAQVLVGVVLVGDEEPLVLEVDEAPHEAEHLAATHAGGDEQHESSRMGTTFRLGAVEQPRRLVGREAPARFLRPRPREGHEVDRIAGDNLVEVSVLHDLAELLVRLVQGRFRIAARLARLRLDGPDHSGREFAQGDVAEQGADMVDIERFTFVRQGADGWVALAELVEALGVLGDGLVGRVRALFVLLDVGGQGFVRVALRPVDRALRGALIAPLFVFLAQVERDLPRVAVALVLLDDAGPSNFRHLPTSYSLSFS